MAGNVVDFLEFLGAEESNQLKSCIHLKDVAIQIGKLDILFKTVINETSIVEEEHKIVVFLFLNVHREFYLSMANFIRLHTSKSYCNLRAAIDSTLTAYYLLNNPDKQEIYLLNRKDKCAEIKAVKEWNRIFKNIKSTINNSINDFPLAVDLIKTHDFCSRFAHADAIDLLTRCFENVKTGNLRVTYFDYEKTNRAYKTRLIDILSFFGEICNLFWKIVFKKRASKKVVQDFTLHITAFQNNLKELKTSLNNS